MTDSRGDGGRWGGGRRGVDDECRMRDEEIGSKKDKNTQLNIQTRPVQRTLSVYACADNKDPILY